jgi:hypothetical protein
MKAAGMGNDLFSIMLLLLLLLHMIQRGQTIFPSGSIPLFGAIRSQHRIKPLSYESCLARVGRKTGVSS